MPLVELLTVLAAVLVSAVVQNVAGFGFALLSVPLMSITVDTRTAVVIAAFLGLTSSLVQAWVGRAQLDRTTATRMTLAAVAGMPAGLWVFTVVNEQTLRLALGISVLGAVAVLASGVRLRHARGIDLAAGAVSGVLATSLSTNGPPLVLALQARDMPAATFRPTINTVFAVSGALSLVGFGVTGGITGAAAIGSAAAVIPLGAGIAIGSTARRHVDGARFRWVVLGLLTVSGVTALLTAL